MRKLLMAAAAMVTVAAGPAYAACSTKDLAGEWALDVHPYCRVENCEGICSGRFNKRGELSTANCTPNVGSSPLKIQIKVRVDRNCRISGAMGFSTDRSPVEMEHRLSGFLGANADQIMGRTEWIGPNGPMGYIAGFSGMRIGQ